MFSCSLQHNTHTRLTALFPGLPRWAGTRKIKPIWISLKQETVRGSDISWAICKSAPCSRQMTTPAPHHSVFYRPDALLAAQPTASKHWRHFSISYVQNIFFTLDTGTRMVAPLLHYTINDMLINRIPHCRNMFRKLINILEDCTSL